MLQPVNSFQGLAPNYPHAALGRVQHLPEAQSPVEHVFSGPDTRNTPYEHGLYQTLPAGNEGWRQDAQYRAPGVGDNKACVSARITSCN